MVRLIGLLFMAILLNACNDGDTGILPTRVSPDAPPPSPTAVSFSQANAVGVLNFWEPGRGFLTSDEADGWRFVGKMGDQITVRVLGIEAILALEAEDGRLLQRDDSISAAIPADGIYTVIVQPAFADASGEYEIGLGYGDRPNPADAVPSPLPELVGVPTPALSFAELGTFISGLTHNEAVGGMMAVGDPDHIYTFDGAVGDYIQLIAIQVSGEIDPRITLYDPDGIPMAVDDDSGEDNTSAILRNIMLPIAGVYAVQIGGGGTAGGYAIRLQQSETPVLPTITPIPIQAPTATIAFSIPSPAPVEVQGNRLEPYVPMKGSLTETNPVAIHPIFVAQGEIISVGTRPSEESTLELNIELRNPVGETVAQGNGEFEIPGTSSVITAFQSPQEGAYQVVVSSENNETGDYIIAYGRGATWSDIAQGEVVRDEINEGNIAERGIRDIWMLELHAGDIITAAVNPVLSTTFDPVLELVPAHDPNTLIAIDDNSGGGFSPYLQRVTIPDTGMYLLRVYATRGATTGSYTLIWRYVNVAPTPTPVLVVSPVLTLDDNVQNLAYQFYPFQGHEGQRVRIGVIGLDEGFDPVVALVGREGEVLIEIDDTDGDLNPIFTYVLPSSGTYNVRVNGYLQGGAFQLFVEEVLN